jgi:hypothetical protein
MKKIAATVYVLLLAFVLAVLAGCRSDDNDKPKDLGISTDGVPPGQEGGVSGAVKIFEINDGTVPEGSLVTIENVIVTAVDGYGQYTDDTYVQDEKGGKGSGLKLYRPIRTDGGAITDLKPGDRVTVKGIVKHFTGTGTSTFPDGKIVYELDTGCEITRLGPGDPPAPAVVTPKELKTEPDAAAWENVLVQVKSVKVTGDKDPDYGDFPVTGGLEIDDDLINYTPTIDECIDVTGISIYFYGYRLNPRTPSDVQPATGCPETKLVKISDIQNEQSADHPKEDDQVKVVGVITAVDGFMPPGDTKYEGFFIQEEGSSAAYSGIYVHHLWEDSAPKKPVLGDKIELIGTYKEYYSVSELSNASWKVLGQSTVPDPAVVNAADVATNGSKAEEYEGVLVKVENFTASEYIEVGSNNTKIGIKDTTSGLMVESGFLDFMTTPPTLNTTYTSITGPLHFSYDNFKILPRTAADMAQ